MKYKLGAATLAIVISVFIVVSRGRALAYTGGALWGGSGIADIQSADLLPAGGVSLGLSYEHLKYVLKVDPKDTYYRLAASVGILDRLEAFASIPYREFEREKIKEDGPGDGLVGLKFRLTPAGAGLSLAALASVTLPAGDEDKGLGTGRWDAVFGLVASKDFGRLGASAQAGLRILENSYQVLEYGLGFMFPMNKPVRGFVEYFGTSGLHLDWSDNDGGWSAGVKADLGSRWQVTAGYGKGLYGEGPRAPDWRVFAAINFYPGRIPGKAPAPATAPAKQAAPKAAAPGTAPPPAPPERPKTATEPEPPPTIPRIVQPITDYPRESSPPPPAPPPKAAEALDLPVEDVYFDYDHMLMKPDEEARLKKVADYLKAHPGARVLVEGHCDSRGTATYNDGLGLRRAKSVAYYLIFDLGVAPGRVEFRSLGEMKPAGGNTTDEGRARNRRGHLVLIK